MTYDLSAKLLKTERIQDPLLKKARAANPHSKELWDKHRAMNRKRRIVEALDEAIVETEVRLAQQRIRREQAADALKAAEQDYHKSKCWGGALADIERRASNG